MKNNNKFKKQGGRVKDIETLLQDYMNNPKWNGKLFMQDEKTCFKDGFLEGAKEVQEENKKLKTRLRTLMPCGYCKHSKNEPPEICTPCLCGECDNWEV